MKDERGAYWRLPGATGPVVWSPDKKHVATLGEDPGHADVYFEQGPNDGSINEHAPVVKIWNAQTGKLLHWWRGAAYQREAPEMLRWLDNKRLAVGAPGEFEVWNAISKKRMSGTPARDDFEISSLQALSPDNKTLVADAARRDPHTPADHVQVTALFQVRGQGRESPATMTTPGPQPIDDLAWSDDGQWIAFSTLGKSAVHVWKFSNSPQKLATSFDFNSAHLAWTKTNRLSASHFNELSLWNPQNHWRQIIRKPPHRPRRGSADDFELPQSSGLFITPDEKILLQLSDWPAGEVWRLDAGQPQPYLWLKAPDSGGSEETISPDGRFYGVPENDTENQKPIYTLYDLQVKNRKLRLEESPRQGAGDARSYTWENIAQFSRDGERAAFGGRIFSLPNGKILGERRDPLNGNALALSSNGALVVRLSNYGNNLGLRLFHAASGKFLRTLSHDAGGVVDATFSPDDKLLCVARFGDLEFYDVASGKLLSKAVVLPPPNPAAKASAARGVTWRAP